jgi:hypothetical protein
MSKVSYGAAADGSLGGGGPKPTSGSWERLAPRAVGLSVAVCVSLTALAAASPASAAAATAESSSVRTLAGSWANHNPFTPVAENGIFGSQTIRATQFVIGARTDGIWGPMSKKALQRYLGVAADGVIGPITVRALQRRVGATVDGRWGPMTTRALQHALNTGRLHRFFTDDDDDRRGLPGPRGPQGAQGQQGQQGQQGPQGPQGPAVGASSTVVSGPSSTGTNGATIQAQADCPAGTYALGGGYTYDGNGTVTDSVFTGGSPATGWYVAENVTGATSTISAYVDCAP